MKLFSWFPSLKKNNKNSTHPVQLGGGELQHLPRVLCVQLPQINNYVT